MKRFCACLLLILALAGLAAAEEAAPVTLSVVETGSLPITLDALEAPPEEYFLSETEYQDETIHIRIETSTYLETKCYVAYVDIADASQLRTAMCSTNIERLRTTTAMAERSGAILAINGDWWTNRKRGYIVREGHLFRDTNEVIRDMLFIDSNGDFHLTQQPSKESTAAIVEQYDIVNSLSFGPAFVIDGELMPIRKDYPFEQNTPSPRTAIGQMGPLSYVMVVCDGRTKASPGLTLAQMGEFMQSLGCKQAFGLDGGGTTTMSFHLQTVNIPCYGRERNLSDIIYFASGLQKLRTE